MALPFLWFEPPAVRWPSHFSRPLQLSTQNDNPQVCPISHQASPAKDFLARATFPGHLASASLFHIFSSQTFVFHEDLWKMQSEVPQLRSANEHLHFLHNMVCWGCHVCSAFMRGTRQKSQKRGYKPWCDQAKVRVPVQVWDPAVLTAVEKPRQQKSCTMDFSHMVPWCSDSSDPSYWTWAGGSDGFKGLFQSDVARTNSPGSSLSGKLAGLV